MTTQFIRALERHRAQSDPTHPLSLPLLESWIHHDNMLEGQLFRPVEITHAFSSADAELDAYLHPLMKRIRLYRELIDYVHAQALTGSAAVTVDNLKAINKMVTPVAKDRGGLFRKTSPVHRDYFQKICPPEKIPSLLKRLLEKTEAELDESPNPIAYAAEFHHQLMFIYPFRRNPGLTARLFTNLVVMSRGYPPIIIPAQKRSEYYNALCENDGAQLIPIFQESVAAIIEGSDALFRPVSN